MSLASRHGLAAGLLASLAAGCSLLAPDDAYFAGGKPKKDAGANACDPLPPPSGTVVHVKNADAATLASVVESAAPDSTILLDDGTYDLTKTLAFAAPRVTLRSAGGDAAKVVLDGGGALGVAIQVRASEVTLADVTIQHMTQSAVLVAPAATSKGLTGTRLHDVHLVDAGIQYVRAAPSEGGAYPDEGVIECSEFRMTDAGRPDACCSDCAPIGLDVVGGRGWTLQRTRFDDIYCAPGPLPFAALFSGGARDTVVENNVFLGCARALGLGVADGTMPRTYPDTPYPGVELDHIDGLVRNNVIYSDLPSFDTGIELNDTREPRVYYNTVVHRTAGTAFFSSIDFRYADTQVVVKDNLAIAISHRDGANGDWAGNLQGTPLAYFVDPDAGDFHLKDTAVDAIDRGEPVAESGVDMDGQTHDIGAAPDLGADEHGAGH